MSDWTVGRILAWTAKDLSARGIDSPRLDAELLLAHSLGLRRIDLYLRHDQALGPEQLAAVRSLVERRRQREPVAYILGSREFYGRTFTVDRRTLVPRPETEHLIDSALAHLRAWESPQPSALDLGTGSGAIAVSLASEVPGLTVDAVDLSPEALAVARLNADRLGVSDRVTLFEGDLYLPVVARRYALVASNPPYVPRSEIDGLMPEVSAHEPRLALDGGDDGADIVREVVRGAIDHLHPGGLLLVEIGDGQGEAARAIAVGSGLRDVVIQRDLARRERLLVASR